MQQTSLKALARNALACNNPRNAGATGPEKPRNFSGDFEAQKLHDVAGGYAVRARLRDLAKARDLPVVLVNRIAADLPNYAGMSDAQLSALLSMLADDADRERGKVPDGDTAAILCRSCGPVWIHPAIAHLLPVVGGWPRALGCPWCFVRKAGLYVPRPPVTCATCRNYQPDKINPAQGCGSCGIGARRSTDPPTYPHATRHCGSWRPTETMP